MMGRDGGLPRLLVVDWDGTVANSLPHIVRSWRRAFEEQLGDEFVPEEQLVRKSVGLPVDLAVEFLWPTTSVLGGSSAPVLNEENIVCVRKAYGEIFRKDRHLTQLFPHARDTLQWLNNNGVQLAVATGKSKRGLDFETELHGIGDLFVTTRTATDSEPKPSPDMLLKILRDTGTSPSDAVMLGDATLDIAMANNAGVMPLGVSFGASTRSALMSEGAEVCFHSWSEISLWFQSRTKPRV